jgi:hypothetical protein
MDKINIGFFIGIVGVFAILFFKEWFFGTSDIDDKQGFPRSRNKKRRPGIASLLKHSENVQRNTQI